MNNWSNTGHKVVIVTIRNKQENKDILNHVDENKRNDEMNDLR